MDEKFWNVLDTPHVLPWVALCFHFYVEALVPPNASNYIYQWYIVVQYLIKPGPTKSGQNSKRWTGTCTQDGLAVCAGRFQSYEFAPVGFGESLQQLQSENREVRLGEYELLAGGFI